MADNYTFKDATGTTTTAASDDVASVHYPRVKITQGADGAAADVSSAAPLEVTGANGSFPVTDSGGSLTVDGTVAVTNGGTFVVQENGAALTALQLIDDTVYTDGTGTVTKGVAILGQDGTNPQAIKTDASGELQVDVLTLPALTAGTNNIGDVDVLTVNGVAPAFGSGVRGATVQRVTIATDDVVPASQSGTWNVATLTTLTGGGVAHDSADSGNPVKIGAKAEATPSTATMVADADRTDLVADLDGALLTRGMALGDFISERVSNTDGASTAFTNFGATASTRNYVYAYSIFRTDAGTTPIYVDFRDGTAGSILYSVVIPPNGGANLSSDKPLFRTTANTALAFDVSAATTTVYISVSGFKSKV